MGRFEGAVAVVTGGAGGLGRAVSAGFLAEGASVGVLDVDEAVCRQVAEELSAGPAGGSARALGVGVDVRDRGAVGAAMQQVHDELGGLDVLVTLAGGSLGTPKVLTEIEADHVDLVVDVNLKGTLYCAQAAVALMSAGGAVVTVSSIGGRQASPVTGVPYAAAKAGILGLTRRLAREVGEREIRVNAVAPGLFLTGRLQQMYDQMPASERDEVLSAIPLGRFPELAELVEPVLFLASPQASYITGVVLDVNGGRFMPT